MPSLVVIEQPNVPTSPQLISSAVFSARDETWKQIRDILTPSFSARKMKLIVHAVGYTVI